MNQRLGVRCKEKLPEPGLVGRQDLSIRAGCDVVRTYDTAMASRFELGRRTSPSIAGQSPLVLVPVGSTEQHGPHLPVSMDTLVATAVSEASADLLAERGVPIMVAPAVAYGSSAEHQDFPGTISIGTQALVGVLVELARSLTTWAPQIAFINGHGGNVAALSQAVPLLVQESRRVGWWSCSVPEADAHAGDTETSLALHLFPEWVAPDAMAVGNTAPLSELMPAMRLRGVRAVSANGVLGDPTTATANKGARYLDGLVESCVAALTAWDLQESGMLA